MRLSKIFPIVLLPIKNEHSNIWMNEKGELRNSSYTPPSKKAQWTPYGLYVYSKEIPCKAGEWHYDSIRKVVTRTATKTPNPNTCFKIVADYCEIHGSKFNCRIPDEFVAQYVISYRKGNILTEIDLDIVYDEKGIFTIDKKIEDGNKAFFSFRKKGYVYLITSLCYENTKITKEIQEKNRIIHVITDVIQTGTETIPFWMIDQLSEKIYNRISVEFNIIKKN